MYCRFCGKEIQEDSRVCQHCGKELSAPEVPAREGKHGIKTSQLVIILVALVVCVALVAAVIVIGFQATGSGETTPTVNATVPTDGDPEDVTCKGTYTEEDKALLQAMSTVVATMGDSTLSNETLQVYYWMQFYEFYEQYYYYASAMGLDVSLSLDRQSCGLSTQEDGSSVTWQQYFLSCALESWRRNQTLANLADANGFEMPDYYVEALGNIENDLLESATANGMSSVEELLQNDMGPGGSLAGYREYLNTYYKGYLYFAQLVDEIQIPEADVEAYFEENKDSLAEDGITKEDETYMVDVRHILIQPVGDTEDATTYTDAQWEACRTEAQRILDLWLAGAADEESFAQLAGEYTQDPGSMYSGGLYANVSEGEMVDEFNDWIFAEDRQYGDTALVKTSYGYHVMFFCGTTPAWYVTCESELITLESQELLEQLLADAQMDVSYQDIVLGEANMG